MLIMGPEPMSITEWEKKYCVPVSVTLIATRQQKAASSARLALCLTELPTARSFATSFCGSPLPHAARSGREVIIPAGALDGDLSKLELPHRRARREYMPDHLARLRYQAPPSEEQQSTRISEARAQTKRSVD